MRYLVAFVLSLLAGPVLAQTCYEYAPQSNQTAWFTTRAAAANAGLTTRTEFTACAFGTQAKWNYSVGECATEVSATGHFCYKVVTWEANGCATSGGQLAPEPSPNPNTQAGEIALVGRVAETCPEQCEDKQGQLFMASANNVGDSWSPQGAGCFDGCAAYLKANNQHTRLGPSGSRYWLSKYEYTGQECVQEPPVDSNANVTAGPQEACVSNGGVEVCQNPSMGPGCGFVNDQYVCLSAAATPNKCFEHTDGSMVCAEAAPTPPAPDNGTPGVKAPADNQIAQTNPSTGTTNTYNYYNSGTVANSGRPPGGEADGNNDGTCQGDNCDEEEGGAGDVTLPELDEGVQGFGEATQGFYDAVSNGPLATAISGNTFSTGGGQCPVASFPGLMSGTLVIDFHCELIDNNSALLAAVFYFMWTIAAVKVFLSA